MGLGKCLESVKHPIKKIILLKKKNNKKIGNEVYSDLRKRHSPLLVTGICAVTSTSMKLNR